MMRNVSLISVSLLLFSSVCVALPTAAQLWEMVLPEEAPKNAPQNALQDDVETVELRRLRALTKMEGHNDVATTHLFEKFPVLAQTAEHAIVDINKVCGEMVDQFYARTNLHSGFKRSLEFKGRLEKVDRIMEAMGCVGVSGTASNSQINTNWWEDQIRAHGCRNNAAMTMQYILKGYDRSQIGEQLRNIGFSTLNIVARNNFMDDIFRPMISLDTDSYINSTVAGACENTKCMLTPFRDLMDYYMGQEAAIDEVDYESTQHTRRAYKYLIVLASDAIHRYCSKNKDNPEMYTALGYQNIGKSKWLDFLNNTQYNSVCNATDVKNSRADIQPQLNFMSSANAWQSMVAYVKGKLKDPFYTGIWTLHEGVFACCDSLAAAKALVDDMEEESSWLPVEIEQDNLGALELSRFYFSLRYAYRKAAKSLCTFKKECGNYCMYVLKYTGEIGWDTNEWAVGQQIDELIDQGKEYVKFTYAKDWMFRPEFANHEFPRMGIDYLVYPKEDTASGLFNCTFEVDLRTLARSDYQSVKGLHGQEMDREMRQLLKISAARMEYHKENIEYCESIGKLSKCVPPEGIDSFGYEFHINQDYMEAFDVTASCTVGYYEKNKTTVTMCEKKLGAWSATGCEPLYMESHSTTPQPSTSPSPSVWMDMDDY